MADKSQNDKILAHLQAGGRLTPLEGYKLCGTLALSSRIAELRKRGHPIHSRLIKTPEGKQVAEYWLDAQPEHIEVAPFILSSNR